MYIEIGNENNHTCCSLCLTEIFNKHFPEEQELGKID